MSNVRATRILALLIAPLGVSAAWAESFTLEQVEALARERAPAIAAAAARTAQAEGRRKGLAAVPDPELTLDAAHARPDGGGPSGSEWGVEAGFSFPAPWGLGARRKAGDDAIRAARADGQTATLDVVFDARRRYIEVVTAEDMAVGLADAARDAATLRDLIARRVEIGEAAGSDRLRADVEARRTELEARAAAADAEGARAALDAFVLGALGPGFRLSSRLAAHELRPPTGGAVEAAVAASPDLVAARARIDAAASRVIAERRARLPGLRIAAFHDVEIDKSATGGAVTFALPLWNRNEAPVRIARAEQAEAEADLARVEAALRGIVAQLAARDAVLRERALAFAEEILPAARESLAISMLALEQGEASLLPWLEARRSYLEVLRASYDARREAFLTQAELHRLLGATHATP
jgi:outer membrane protein TolC